MLRAKLGLTAVAAKSERAIEQNAAAFDLKTCHTQSPQGTAGEGLCGLEPSSATALVCPALYLAERDLEQRAEGTFTGSCVSYFITLISLLSPSIS